MIFASGAQLNSCSPRGGRRTRRCTVCPAAVSCCTSSVPISPEAPATSTRSRLSFAIGLRTIGFGMAAGGGSGGRRAAGLADGTGTRFCAMARA